MRSAIIENGIVANVIMGEITGSVPCDDDVGIGWLYDGEVFTAPPQPEPEQTPPTLAEQKASRAAAYRGEADPLFFKYQRGEATEQEWLDKIEEIRARYPYPEE